MTADNTPEESGTGRVLVVEDEPATRALIEYKLQNSGYAVQTVSDGTEALAFLSRERVDLVILDLMMPVMTGMELLVTLRSRSEFGTLPVIILTARTRGNGQLFVSGAFGMFRKDVVLRCGGYRRDTAGEDMELVVGIHRRLLEEVSFARYPGSADLLRLLLFAVLENLGYRKATVWWRVRGMIDALRGKGGWGTLKRTAFARSPDPFVHPSVTGRLS